MCPTVVSLQNFTFKSNNKSTAAFSSTKYFLIRLANPSLTADNFSKADKQLLLVAAQLSWLRRVSIHYCCVILIKALCCCFHSEGRFSSLVPPPKSCGRRALPWAKKTCQSLHLLCPAPHICRQWAHIQLDRKVRLCQHFIAPWWQDVSMIFHQNTLQNVLLEREIVGTLAHLVGVCTPRTKAQSLQVPPHPGAPCCMLFPFSLLPTLSLSNENDLSRNFGAKTKSQNSLVHESASFNQ